MQGTVHTCMCQYSVQLTELHGSAGGGLDWTPGGHGFESCPKDLSSSCIPYRATSLHRLSGRVLCSDQSDCSLPHGRELNHCLVISD